MNIWHICHLVSWGWFWPILYAVGLGELNTIVFPWTLKMTRRTMRWKRTNVKANNSAVFVYFVYFILTISLLTFHKSYWVTNWPVIAEFYFEWMNEQEKRNYGEAMERYLDKYCHDIGPFLVTKWPRLHFWKKYRPYYSFLFVTEAPSLAASVGPSTEVWEVGHIRSQHCRLQPRIPSLQRTCHNPCD